MVLSPDPDALFFLSSLPELFGFEFISLGWRSVPDANDSGLQYAIAAKYRSPPFVSNCSTTCAHDDLSLLSRQEEAVFGRDKDSFKYPTGGGNSLSALPLLLLAVKDRLKTSETLEACSE